MPSRTTTPDKNVWNELNRLAEERAKTAPMASMPLMNHLTMKDFDQVYEPAEDTFLFLDALQYEFQQGSIPPPQKEEEEEQLSKDGTTTTAESGVSSKPPFVVLEIGCGSGVVSTLFRTLWKKHKRNDLSVLQSFVTDINPKALQVTLKTDQLNNYPGDEEATYGEMANPNACKLEQTLPPMEAIQCDLASALLPRWQHQVDVILFNPPYVPTEDSEVVDGSSISSSTAAGIEAAWAGGRKGRRVMDRAVPQIAQLLKRDGGGSSRGGVAYLVTVDDNDPAQLNASLIRSAHLVMTPLFRRRARNEFLTIQKITWIRNDSCGGGDDDDDYGETKSKP
ncbi:hypothetical protein ACA910_007823 [Epithemia clementina (nom. ined.)]